MICYQSQLPSSKKEGFTLIEVLVGTFLLLIVFLGIFSAYQLTLKVIGRSKSEITATAIANGELEKIRNVPYQSVGIIGGFPDGVLEAFTTDTRNNINYTIEKRIDYVIDSRDGIASPDDECPNDYKRVEVKVSWSGLFGGEVKFDTDVSPESLAQECAETGGILLVSVFDDTFGFMIPSPLIEVKDPETDEIIKTATPFEGSHFFSLPPSAYKIVVSKASYSTSRTYGIDEITSPEKPNPLVIEGELTEMSFSIDKVSSFSIDTLSPWGMNYFSDSFLNMAKISGLSGLEVNEGEVILEKIGDEYINSGYLISTPISPASLIIWDEFSFTDFELPGTQITYQILYFDEESWVLIPDVDLVGNSAGFGTSPIDLSGLDAVAYPQLEIKSSFSTTNPLVTPALYDWQIFWKNSQATSIPSAAFNLQGAKIIGSDGDENPVYKYSQEHISGGDGHINIPDIEGDNYTFLVDPATGLDLEDTNPSPQPIGLSPDTTSIVTLYLKAQNSLFTTVQDIDSGEPVFAANVRLYKSDLSYDETQNTNEKGQAYFIPLEAGAYTIKVSLNSYETKSEYIFVLGYGSTMILLLRLE